jgi:hypothetical protein
MKIHNKLLIAALLITSCQAQIRILLTAAITDAHAEFRKAQYIETFTILADYGYTKDDLYVVEALKKTGPSFLEDYAGHVFYATTNDPTFINNGINEAATVLEAIHHFGFDDEDMIIKFTGRHQLTSDYLLRLVENNLDYDTLVKVNSDYNVFTLGFAMKCKYLKEMFGAMDFKNMGYILRPVEYDVGDYIKLKVRQGNFKVFYIPELHMKAQLFGSSTAPGVEAQVLYY